MQFDLVDEMHWEDLVEFESLESAGLETYDKDTVPGAMQQYFEDEQ